MHSHTTLHIVIIMNGLYAAAFPLFSCQMTSICQCGRNALEHPFPGSILANIAHQNELCIARMWHAAIRDHIRFNTGQQKRKKQTGNLACNSLPIALNSSTLL